MAAVALGTFGINGLINSVVALVAGGYSSGLLVSMVSASAELALGLGLAVYLLYRLDLGTGSIKRRVKALEVGWKE